VRGAGSCDGKSGLGWVARYEMNRLRKEDGVAVASGSGIEGGKATLVRTRMLSNLTSLFRTPYSPTVLTRSTASWQPLEISSRSIGPRWSLVVMTYSSKTPLISSGSPGDCI